MSNLKIWIPLLPPGINETYKIGNGHLYKSEKAKSWENDAALIIGSEAQDWMDDSEFYEIDIILQNTRTDVDASIKLMIDVLSNKLGFNDNRILRQCSEKVKSDEKGVFIILRNYEKSREVKLGQS